MKVLIPVQSAAIPFAAVERLVALRRAGVEIEALVLNVQPLFSRHVSQFTTRWARDDWRAEHGRAAMARVLALLDAGGVPHREIVEAGRPAERIAAVAAREKVDEVVATPQSFQRRWLPWLIPAGVGLAALLLTAE